MSYGIITPTHEAAPRDCNRRGHGPRSKTSMSDTQRIAHPWVMDRLWAKVTIGAADECWPFTGATGKRGYGRIGLGGRNDGTANAHRVVCEAAHGLPAPGQQARHLCGNRACCNPAHLTWGTQSQNEMDKVAHGLSNRGERHGLARLTAEQVREIRARCSEGESQRAVARAFGISQQSVSEIVTRRTWGWLDA